MASRQSNTTTITSRPLDVQFVRHGELREEFDKLDNILRHEFAQQHEFVEAKFTSTTAETRASFEQLSKQVKTLEGQVQVLEDRRREDRYFLQNRLAVRPFQIIKPIAHNGMIPNHSPLTVRRFWKLMRPENLSVLTELLEYYEFKEYYAWEEVNADRDRIWKPNNELSITSKTKEQFFVEHYPTEAHCALASILGLDYGAIADSMARLEKHRVEQCDALPTSQKRREDPGEHKPLGRQKKYTRPASDASSLTEPNDNGLNAPYKPTVLSSRSEGTLSDTPDPWAPF